MNTIVLASRHRLLINVALFQLGWWCCVVGGDNWALPVTVTILALHGLLLVRASAEWQLIGLVAAVGTVIDSALAQAGMLLFSGNQWLPIPLWLICLWLVFATLFCHSLVWLQHRLRLAALLAGVGGASSYWAGAVLAEVQLGQPQWLSLSVLFVVWAALVPALLYLARRYNDA